MESQQTCYVMGNLVLAPVHVGGGVWVLDTFKGGDVGDMALGYLAPPMFSVLHSLTESPSYTCSKK